MAVRLQLFDRLQVMTDAVAPARVLRPRGQRLLAYLLLLRHKSLARENAAITLWPDSPEAEALGTLRRALNELRAVLPAPVGPDWVVTAGGELRWNLEAPYWLDIEEFERGLRAATPAALQQAVGLYTGDLLAAWDDDWLWGERERLRRLQIGALHRLVAHHRAGGDHGAALELARQGLSLDPFNEAAHRDLIALHYEAGDRAAALVAYDRLRALLREELAVEPMAETQALRAAIVRGASLPAAQVAIGGPAPVPPPTLAPSGLIGRDAELTRLAALWEGAAAGHGRLVVVSGEAGVGKSHLALSLADHAARRGGLALAGHCYEFERALPYQALVEILRSAAPLLRQAGLPPAHRALLARLAPELLDAGGDPALAAEGISADARAQLFEALLQAFLALARRQPLLILVEDAHWAAAATLDWLTYIAPRLGASRLLVAVTYRLDEVGARHALGRLQRRFAPDGAVATLPLQRLSREAHRQLVTHLSGLDAAQAVPVADRLFAETAGNPFYLHEIVRGLLETGRLRVAAGRWVGTLVEAAPTAEVLLPDSLREAIGARVARLAARPRAFIQAAAVAGRVFEYQAVQQAGGWTDEQALEALEVALARGFFRPGEREGEFAFTHQLVREAIYTGVAAPRRVYWHRRFAEALIRAASRLSPAQSRAMAGPIVHHARHARDFALVFRWAALAAEHAAGLHAYADALGALETASEALDRARGQPDFDLEEAERRHIGILLERAALIPWVGRPRDEHGRVMQAAADLLARYPDEHLRARYALCQSEYLVALNQYERAAEVALDAHARYVALEDRRGAAQGLYQAGSCNITISRNTAGRRFFERALALYQALGDATGEALCLSGLAWARLNLGEVEFALGHLTQALELSERRADRIGMARVCYTLAAAWAFYHNPARVREFAERSLRLYREVGYRLTTYRPMLFLAEAHRLEGDFARARPICEQLVAEARAYHDGWLEGWASQILGRLALGSGDTREAERWLRRAYALRRESGELQNQISDLSWLGRLCLTQGQADAAREYTSQAVAQLVSLDGECYVWETPDVLLTHAEALAATGDESAACAFLRRAHDAMLGFAAQIRDPLARRTYLAYPLNARLAAAWEAGKVPAA